MDPLELRPLGKSGISVTAMGFGGAPLGGFRGVIPEEEATGCVRTAYDAGLRYLDTSPYYGYGRSELRFGHILRDLPRDSYVLSTKIGRVMHPLARGEDTSGLRPGGLPFKPEFDYSYDGVMRSMEQSCIRLGINEIDVVYIHDVDIYSHGSAEAYERRYAEAVEGAMKALVELRKAGVIKAIGVGLNDTEPCLRFARDTDIDCMLVAGRYTLLEQEALDELFPLCAKKNIGVVIGGPFNSGILVTGPVEGASYFYSAAGKEVLERVRVLQAACEEHGVPMPAAALQFTLHHPVVSSVIPGAVSRSEILQNIDWMRMPIPAAFWQDLKVRGLLHAKAPVPA